MSSKFDKKKTDETFEAGLERLKNIVDGLEKTDISLDDALNGFEEGIKLSRKLSDKLTQAEARLEMLTKGADGKPKVSPMDDGDDDGTVLRFESEDEDEDEYDEDSDDEDEDEDEDDDEYDDDDDD
jgi:exodeoxyribonuclease VII small subunit